MGTMKRIAMTSTSKFSTINFGLAFFCELYLFLFLGNTPNDHLVSLPNNSSGDLGCNYPLSPVNSKSFTDHWLYSQWSLYYWGYWSLFLKGSHGRKLLNSLLERKHVRFNECVLQLWLDNRAEMEFTLSSTFARLSSTISGLYNSFLGQSPSQARLNAITSYDQSNELFKV